MPGGKHALSAGEYSMSADGDRMLDGRNADGLPPDRNAMSGGADQVPGTGDALSAFEHAMPGGADAMPGDGDGLCAASPRDDLSSRGKRLERTGSRIERPRFERSGPAGGDSVDRRLPGRECGVPASCGSFEIGSNRSPQRRGRR